MGRVRKAAVMPPHLVARKYLGVGDIYGEARLLRRTGAPGVEAEAVGLYYLAGVKYVRVFMADGAEWVCGVERLFLEGEEFMLDGRRLLSVSAEHWTVTPSPSQSLF